MRLTQSKIRAGVVLCQFLTGFWLAAQCPVITDSELSQNQPSFCIGDVLTFTVEGNDLPAGDVIDWYLSTTSGFNPYAGEGASIGTAQITQDPCFTQPEILYLMVNPDNAQVGSADDRCDEFIIIYTGSGGYTPNDIVVSNLAGGAQWNDFIPGNAATFNCGVPLNPGDPVPPNSILIIQANATNNVMVDLGGICASGLSVYIIAYNTAPVCTGGYLDNSSGGGCASCPVNLNINGSCMYSTSVDYNPPASTMSGWGYSNQTGGGVYANVVPPVSIPPFMSGGATVEPFNWTIPVDFCSTFGAGTYYITGILNPAPTGGCAQIFADEFQIAVSCPSASLSGDIAICSGSCPDNPGQLSFSFSGGSEPYSIDLSVTASVFPPFQIPGIAFNGSGNIQVCIGGILPSYDPNTMTLTVPSALIGQSVAVSLLSVTDSEGCQGTIIPPAQLVINIYQGPVAMAGPNLVVCGGSFVMLNGSLGGAAQDAQWITDGDGSFGNPSMPQTTYSPGASDIANGSVTLTLIASELSGNCDPDSSSILVTILEAPEVDAGPDQVVCAATGVQLAGSFFGGASSATWSSSGDGTFDNINNINAVYTPGTGDVSSGTVTLYLTSDNAGGQCMAAIDSVELTLISPPMIMGPSSGSVCAGDLASLSQIVTGNPAGVLWTTSGDGTFDDPAMAATLYMPGVQDTTNGIVTLTLTATTQGGLCPPVQFVFTLTIFDCACPDLDITPLASGLCNFEGMLNMNSLIVAADPGTWQITGVPPGISPAILNDSIFNAHNADAGIYTVTYTLTNPVPGCDSSASVEVPVIDDPKISAGLFQTICAPDTVILNGELIGVAGSLQWQSSGGGIFSDADSLNTIYYPDSMDFASGSVLLSLSVTDTAGVCPVGYDTILISFTPHVIAMLTSDSIDICNDSMIGSVINLNTYVTGGAMGTWQNPTGIPIDLTNPSVVDFDGILPGNYLLEFSVPATGPCPATSDSLIVQVLSCVCPPVTITPLPTAVCGSGPGVNLDAFVTSSQSGTWIVTQVPSGMMPATLIDPFLNTTNADPGDYEVAFVLDNPAPGCPDTFPLNVTVLEPPVVFPGNDTTICADGQLQLSGTANASTTILTWSTSGDGMFGDPSDINTVYIPGMSDISNGSVQISLTGADTAGVCAVVQQSLTLSLVAPPFAVFDTLFIALCNVADSGSVLNLVDLITSGDADGSWQDLDLSGVDLSDPKTVDFDGVNAGIYTFRYTTASAIPPCMEASYVLTVEVMECQCPDLTFIVPEVAICDGDSIALNQFLSVPQAGTWALLNINTLSVPPVITDSVLVADNATAGTYVLKFAVADSVDGCPASGTIALQLNAVAQYEIGDVTCVTADSSYEVFIITDALNVVPELGAIVELFPDAYLISGIPQDTDFAIMLETGDGCITQVNVTAPDCSCELVISGVPDSLAYCENDTLHIDAVASGAIVETQYWITPSDTVFSAGIDVSTPGTYTFYAEAENGCDVSVDLIALETPAMNPTIEAFGPICPGGNEGAIFIENITSASLPIMYSLNGQTFQLVDTFPWSINGLTAGSYVLTLQGADGCELMIPLTLDDPALQFLELGPDIIIDQGDSVFIDPVVSFIPDQITYSPALLDTLSGWVSPIQSTLLMLDVIDISGCLYHDEIQITVNQRRGIYTPSVFSPNGDQVNDRWTLYTEDRNALIMELNIYDRWGGVRYTMHGIPSNDPSVGWDGSSNGHPLDPGVYVFMAKLILSDGEMVTFGGDITLVK